MSKSLPLAFCIALVLHSLLAWVDLDLGRNPPAARILPRTVTIDIATPKPVTKSLAVEKPLVGSKKEPVIKKEIKRHIKPKHRTKPKVVPKEKVQPEKKLPAVEPEKKPATPPPTI